MYSCDIWWSSNAWFDQICRLPDWNIPRADSQPMARKLRMVWPRSIYHNIWSKPFSTEKYIRTNFNFNRIFLTFCALIKSNNYNTWFENSVGLGPINKSAFFLVSLLPKLPQYSRCGCNCSLWSFAHSEYFSCLFLLRFS